MKNPRSAAFQALCGLNITVNWLLTRTQSEQVVNKGAQVRHTVPSSVGVVPGARVTSSGSEFSTGLHAIEMAGRAFSACQFDSRSKGSVPVSGVQKRVLLRSVDVSGVGQLRSLRVRSAFVLPQCEARQSPREVLAFAMTELRRAAEAKKGLRIAQRLAILAEGKSERVTWSSQKSLRGVH